MKKTEKKRIQYRDKTIDKTILYAHIHTKTKEIIRDEARRRDLSMTKLVSEILNNAAKQFR